MRNISEVGPDSAVCYHAAEAEGTHLKCKPNWGQMQKSKFHPAVGQKRTIEVMYA